MTRNLRLPGLILWVAWIVAGALGGGLATLLKVAGLGNWVSGGTYPDYGHRVLLYFALWAAVAALFQYLLLQFVAPVRAAALLWLPATMVGIAMWYLALPDLATPAGHFATWLTGTFSFFPAGTASAMVMAANDASYPLPLGVAQGVVLALVTRRKSAPAIWIAANVLAWFPSDYVAHLDVGLSARGAALVVSSAYGAGAYAAATGLALVVVFRAGRGPRAVALMPAAELQGQG